MNSFRGLSDKAIKKGGITPSEALRVLHAKRARVLDVFAEANRVREHFFGNRISLCSILNIKSGACSEDCAFCAQSGRYKTGAPVHGLVTAAKMADYARRAKGYHCRLGLVTSGKGVLKARDFERLLSDIRGLKRKCDIHASLGLMTLEQAHALKKAGVTVYHHNIETAPLFFKKIVHTHTFKERIVTLLNAKAADMRVCCGGILGMGESLEQRVEMAFAIKKLEADMVPLNFLNPIPGTPLGKRPLMEPLDALLSVSMFRLVNPTRDLRVCGGRDVTLRELQPLVFLAGASGLMTGDYLTTQGRRPEDDLRLIRDLGLVPA
ncbi:MAG: biotin synthase BioB [Fibrobacterota bacterium]